MIDNKQKNSQVRQKKSKPSITEMSTLIYGIMAAVGIGFCLWSHQNFWNLVSIPGDSATATKLLTITGLGLGVLLIGSYFFESWFKSFRDARMSMMTLLGNISVLESFYLAFLSSVGEEFLFRGAILPSAGIYFSSILFGLLHIGPKGFISSWSIWATLSGLLLALIVESTGSILPAITIHFIVNAVSILLIRRDWLRLSETEQKNLKKKITELETQEL
ncbi:MAG: CPBP family intramembrane glutamic endopeptidase [Bdellovibrionota bacterium]